MTQMCYLSIRFKNVMFEIKSADEVGVFVVSAKFMGVAMEKVELVFQVRKNNSLLFSMISSRLNSITL